VIARVLCLLVLWTAVARAGDEPDTVDGKAYFADGTAAFQRGDYAAASRAFAAGYEIEKWNGFLFAWAQSERVAGDCKKAVELYSRFIATDPEPAAREHALGWIRQCGSEYVPPEPVDKPVDKPVDTPVTPRRPPPPPTPAPAPESRFPHTLALVLGASAVASGGVGIGFYVGARRDFRRADRAVDYVDVAAAEQRGERRLWGARIAGGIAVALATAAVVRFVVHRSPRLEVTAAPGTVAVSGRF